LEEKAWSMNLKAYPVVQNLQDLGIQFLWAGG
jgi:hypothetical protein